MNYLSLIYHQNARIYYKREVKESEELDWGFTSVATNLRCKIIRKKLEELGYGE